MSTLPTLTTDQAYQAMRAFLEAYWERGGRPDSQLTDLLLGCKAELARPPIRPCGPTGSTPSAL